MSSAILGNQRSLKNLLCVISVSDNEVEIDLVTDWMLGPREYFSFDCNHLQEFLFF